MAHTPPGRTREKVFRFVQRRLLAGAPPTVREVQEAMGFRAVESARKHLEALVAEGRLIKNPGRARGYRVAQAATARPPVAVPVLGEVRAGLLHEAIEAPDGHVAVETRVAPDRLFALRVRGESMIDAGILPGDLVIVRRQKTAEPGATVVAMIDGEATVKTFKRRGRKVVLVPANPDFEPIECAADELELLGVVIEVRRHLA